MAFWLDKTSMDAGDTVTGHVDGIASRWHKMTFSVLGHSRTDWIGTGYNADQPYNVPLDWITSIPNANSATLTCTLQQFDMYDQNGVTPLSTQYRYLTVTVPSSVLPTMASFTATRNNNGVNAAITGYVRNYTKVNLAMGAVAGAYGSTISNLYIVGGGAQVWATSALLGPFGAPGVITFTAVVVDSRGRSVSRQVSITVLDYASPAFSAASAYRCNAAGDADSAGAYIKLKATPVVYGLNGQNSSVFDGRIYMSGGTPGAFTVMTSNVDWLTGGALLYTKSYIAEIRITDLINTYSIFVTIPTDTVGLHILDGVTGAAVGKYAEVEDVFESAWPICGPVGSIFAHQDSTPAALGLPGTWAAKGYVTTSASETIYFWERTA